MEKTKLNTIKHTAMKKQNKTINEIETEKHLVAQQPNWPSPSLVAVEKQLLEFLQVFEQVFAQVLATHMSKKTSLEKLILKY
jgi:hypothetical protein